MPDLREYRQKRDPHRTPEPFGGEVEAPQLGAGVARSFVVQQHAARSLHYDFRLEIGGVLVSWAVPRGPSLDPEDRRLAVRTEDHPLEYADFEGIIPSGNYGAGAVIVWDCGRYWTSEDHSPQQGLQDGKLELILEGYKLVGRFVLIRTKGADSRQWLLRCKRPAMRDGRRDDLRSLVEREPRSVLSGLTVAELAAGECRAALVEALLESARPSPWTGDPTALEPMLASTADAPFSKPGWIFEAKHDGVRVLASKRGGEVALRSRRGRDVSLVYPEIARAVARLPVDEFVIDGEVIARDTEGRSSFELLQKRMTLADPRAVRRALREVPVELCAFDLPMVHGHDLRGLPLRVRKRVLRGFVPELGMVRYTDHVEEQGHALYALAEQHGFEGIMAKLADSTYEAGQRSPTWLKIKVPHTALLRVIGTQPGNGARAALGSLLLAGLRGSQWCYVGRVGSGLDDATVTDFARRFQPAPASGFAAELPADVARKAVPVSAALVAEVRYTEVTREGLLRQPVLLRLREDVPLEQCVAPRGAEPDAEPVPELAPAAEPADEPLVITRPEKVFWPQDGYTKGDLIAYYQAVWPFLAPYLRDRPLVLTRYPDGIHGSSFFQKNAPEWIPRWVQRSRIEDTDYYICNDPRTLLYVANSAAIPLHVWNSRTTALERPDWLVLDLDPSGATLAEVIQVARQLRVLLESLECPSFVKTSGQSGLHVMVPLAGQLDHDEARSLGEVLARAVCEELPQIATVVRSVAGRGARVYVDFLQNGRGKLIAAPLAVRPVPGATVSMPIPWSRVTARLDLSRYTIRTAVAELERSGDPMLPLLEQRADVPALLERLAERMARPAR